MEQWNWHLVRGREGGGGEGPYEEQHTHGRGEALHRERRQLRHSLIHIVVIIIIVIAVARIHIPCHRSEHGTRGPRNERMEREWQIQGSSTGFVFYI